MMIDHTRWIDAFLGALLMMSTPLAAQQVTLDTDRWNQTAIEWVRLLRAGDFNAAAEWVDPAVPAGAMSADRLATIWGQLTGQLGGLRALTPGPVSESGAYHAVDLGGAFENQELTVRVVLTDGLEVSGFFLNPAAPPPYEAPPYADTAAFHELDTTVGEEPWTLPGVLTVPQGDGPFPAVVLVHGSGPNDRDETIGGNRPFRDLAWGLASRGVAVLRYDKRTRVHGLALPPAIGLDEEVVDDALHAIELMRRRAEVDSTDIFVLGHSLGGMLGPRIAQRAGDVAGLIVLAGPARPLLEVLQSQLEYLASLEPDPAAPARAGIDSILADVERYVATGATPNDSLLGVQIGYWEEVRAVDPVATARELAMPMLILQGGRDYQVTEEDLAIWRQGLTARDDVTVRLYPELNHLFAPGAGTATPAEYTNEVKHVAPAVIEDLADWILRISS